MSEAKQLFDNGLDLFREGKFDDAVRQLKLSIDKDPSNWTARLYLGMSYYKNGQLENAESVFRYTVSKCPDEEVKRRAEVALAPVMDEVKRKSDSQTMKKPQLDPRDARAGFADNGDDSQREPGLYMWGGNKPSDSQTMRKPTPGDSQTMKKPSNADSQSMKKPTMSDSQTMKKPGGADSQTMKKPGTSQTMSMPKPEQLMPTFVRNSIVLRLLWPYFVRLQTLPNAARLVVLLLPVVAIAYFVGKQSIPFLYTGLFIEPGSKTALPNIAGVETKCEFIGPNGAKLQGVHYKVPDAKHIVIVHVDTMGSETGTKALIEGLVSAGNSVFVYDHSGMGASQGTASLSNLVDDGMFAHDYVHGLLEYPHDHIVHLGINIGTGVASAVGTQRPCAGIILIQPFESLPELAAVQLPALNLYSKSDFPEPKMDNVAALKNSQPPHAPLLIIQEKKAVIPPEQGQQLFFNASDPKRIEMVSDSAAKQSVINTFMESIK